jgi:hypothetical protein
MNGSAMVGCRRVQSLEYWGDTAPEAGTLFAGVTCERSGEDAAEWLRSGLLLLELPQSID